jgi:hypothetical protein
MSSKSAHSELEKLKTIYRKKLIRWSFFGLPSALILLLCVLLEFKNRHCPGEVFGIALLITLIGALYLAPERVKIRRLHRRLSLKDKNT